MTTMMMAGRGARQRCSTRSKQQQQQQGNNDAVLVQKISVQSVKRLKKEKTSSGLTALAFCCCFILVWIAPVYLIQHSLRQHHHHQQQQQEQIDNNGNEKTKKKIRKRTTQYHLVFSTDCSDNQNWQSYVFLYHAHKIRQPGIITRIASGCTIQQQQSLGNFYKNTLSQHFGDNIRIHFTPNYMNLDHKGTKFPYFNKPFGLLHWMENVLGYSTTTINNNNNNNHNENDDSIIVLLDPDMILLRPITRYFDHNHDNNNNNNSLDRWTTNKDDDNNNIPFTMVTHQRPVAQEYQLNSFWLDWNLTQILGTSSSPIFQLTKKDVMKYYQVGPPYMATARDMYRIVRRWTKLCIPVRKVYSHSILAEMYAYVIAIADLNLPHKTSRSFMWSDPRTLGYNEPWDWIESIPPNQLCQTTTTTTTSSLYNQPFVFHYCQVYSFQGWKFYKHDLNGHDFYNCNQPLLAEPPRDLASNLLLLLAGGQIAHESIQHESLELQHQWSERIYRRQAFATCRVIAFINEAMMHHRRHACPHDGSNVDKTIRITKNHTRPFLQLTKGLQALFAAKQLQNITTTTTNKKT